jgi:hypothetical protein
MKIILPASNYTFTPSLNRVDFSPMGANFDSKRLLAIIDVKTGKTIYATGSSTAGLGGTFSGNLLTYASSNAGQLASDPLQIFYDDEFAIQQVGGSVSISGPVSVSTPVQVEGGIGSAHSVATAIHDGSGTFPILSTPDPLTGRDGLDINLQSSSYGGLLNNPLPLPYQNQALSVGFINGGDLVAPALDPVTNELMVKSTPVGTTEVNIASTTAPIQVDLVSNSAGAIETNLNLGGVSATTGLGAVDSATLRTSSNISYAGISAATGAGATTAGTQRVVLANDATVSTDVARFGGTATSLGQKASSASIPVVLSSDDIVSIERNEVYLTGAPTNTLSNNLLNAVAGPNSQDFAGFRSAAVQVVSSTASGAFIFEHSADNINFQNLPVFRTDSSSPNAILGAIAATAGSFVYQFPIVSRYVRLRVSTALGANVQAFTRVTADPFVPQVVQVINSTAANLNATVGGSLTSVGTVTTLTTCSTVSSVTSAALSATTVTDIASAAITTTQTSANIVTGNQQSMSFQVGVTAVSGTNPTLDVVVQETFDGTNYYDIYHFPRITAIGQYQSPQMRITGAGIRYVRTVGGGTPSFTNSVLRPVRQVASDNFRNFISRTIDPNTLGSTTASFAVDGCDQFQLAATMNAGGTAPVFKMQGSEDNLNWYDLPSMSLTAVAGSSAQIAETGTSMPKFIRGIVATAGSGSSLFCLFLKARGV